MRILQLSSSVANQIAAGEVIERPASIVKELLENSCDAKADSINIEIGYGGLNLVKISDNGMGIVAEDLPLAIAAHATSKITKLLDLYAITSMGFRGEALASIASVTRLSISSKPGSQEHGMMLQCHPPPCKLIPFARTQGTTVEVRDIFYNAPVRKKFLKTERAEFQAIDMVVRRFALGYPEIAINLIHNGKAQLQLPAAKERKALLARITKLLGKQFVEQAYPIDSHHAQMRLHGWISGLDYQRSQNDKLWVYINGRMVKDKLINHAIKQAYDSLLHPGRHPACLLYLTVNPSEVDVNVHPTKHEVRFQQPRLIHDFISSELRQILEEPTTITNTFKTKSIRNDLELRENYIPKIVSHNLLAQNDKLNSNRPGSGHNLAIAAEKSSRFLSVSRDRDWMILNDRFTIFRLHQQAYLVDLNRLQNQCLFNCLEKAPLPLANRPLLVPIHLDNPCREEMLQSATILLHQLGVKIELTASQLAIKSMPVQVPNLNIKSFLSAFFNCFDQFQAGTITKDLRQQEALLRLLVDNQSFIMQQITDDQFKEFLLFLHESPLDQLPFSTFLTCLSEKSCQEIMNAT